MLSVLSYGRLVARAVLGGLSQTDGRDYSLISASYGFGKDFRKGILKKGMCYGDDACFIARNRNADVLGMTATILPLCVSARAQVTFSQTARALIPGIKTKRPAPSPLKSGILTKSALKPRVNVDCFL